MRRRALALAALVVAASCGSPTPVRAPRTSIEIAHASDLLPNDLDFVVRVDWGRLRASSIYDVARRGLSSAELGPKGAALRAAIDRAKVLFVGGRLLPDGFRGDGVLAIDGDEAEFDPGAAFGDRFQKRPSPAANVDVFELVGQAARGDPAVVAVLKGRGIAVATAAEADAVLRILGSGADTDRLDPPARGLLSFVGAAHGMAGYYDAAGPRGRLLRRLADGLQKFSGAMDLGEGLRVEAELVYATHEGAWRAAEAAREVLALAALLGGSWGSLKAATRIEPSGETLQVRATIPIELLVKLH